MASNGGEYLVYLTTNGLSGGTQVKVSFQDGITVKTGKGNTRKTYKEGMAWTARTEDGFEFDMTILLEEPLGAAAAILMDAHDNNTLVYAYVQTTKTGGQRWHGKMAAVMTEAPLPVSGGAEATFNLSQSGAAMIRATV